MVLSLKRWKSRSSPGIEAGARARKRTHSLVGRLAAIHARHAATRIKRAATRPGYTSVPRSGSALGDAGWSSPVARQAHNLKVTGSNPVPATTAMELDTPPLGAASSVVAQASRSLIARLPRTLRSEGGHCAPSRRRTLQMPASRPSRRTAGRPGACRHAPLLERGETLHQDARNIIALLEPLDQLGNAVS
jgi:hypothetical protein